MESRDCYLELFLASCEHMFRFPSGLALVVAEHLERIAGSVFTFFLQVVLEEGEVRVELAVSFVLD